MALELFYITCNYTLGSASVLQCSGVGGTYNQLYLFTLTVGRTYLSQNGELLRTLVDSLKMEDDDTIARENVLGTLQKLSLR